MVPLWVHELADSFWSAVGEEEPFPRDLAGSIPWAFPLWVSRVPELSISRARHYLEQRGVLDLPAIITQKDRRLRACLLARAGGGTILVDANDSPQEQRFSLAHELAHFLRDYWRQRQRASRRLGPRILEVLDGKRPPEEHERLHGLLGRVSTAPHTHLMTRDATGTPTGAVALAEDEADRLAYELLAPAEAVLGTLRDPGFRLANEGVLPRLEHQALRTKVVALLDSTFGLPTLQAVRYTAHLLPAPRRDPLSRRLRASTSPEKVSNFREVDGK